MYQFRDASGSLCIPCPSQGCFPFWGGFWAKLQLLILTSDFQLSPKTVKLWEMFIDLPAFWECKKQLKVSTHCTSFKFCVRRKSSAVFQQGQLDTHIYHTKSLGQDRASTSELPPCSWGKNCISSWLQLPIPTVQILSSNPLIPFSAFLSQRKKKLLFRNKAAEENHSREGRQRKNLKNPCKLINECRSTGVPGQKRM